MERREEVSERTKNTDKWLPGGKPCAKFTFGSQVKEMELVADLEGGGEPSFFCCSGQLSEGRLSWMVGSSMDSRKPVTYRMGFASGPRALL